MLVDEFRGMHDIIGLYHMKSLYKEDENTVNFLYKFVEGVAPESFGIFVAKLAGINVKIIMFKY